MSPNSPARRASKPRPTNSLRVLRATAAHAAVIGRMLFDVHTECETGTEYRMLCGIQRLPG